MATVPAVNGYSTTANNTTVPPTMAPAGIQVPVKQTPQPQPHPQFPPSAPTFPPARPPSAAPITNPFSTQVQPQQPTHPNVESITTIGKRKRSDSPVDHSHRQALAKVQKEIDPVKRKELLDGFVKNFLVVLTVHDTAPSILHQPISTDRGTQTKRAKTTATSSDAKTLQERLSIEDYYTSLNDISLDTNSAIDTVLLSLSPQSAAIPKIQAFKELALQLVKRTVIQHPSLANSYDTPRTESDADFVTAIGSAKSGETVAMAYQTGPHVYYSSLQQASAAGSKLALQPGSNGALAPISTAQIPQSVHLTKSYPKKSEAKAATIGEAFPTREKVKLMPIIPNVVAQPASTAKKADKDPLSSSFKYKTAQWLDYGPFSSFAPTVDSTAVVISVGEAQDVRQFQSTRKAEKETQTQTPTQTPKVADDKDKTSDDDDDFVKGVEAALKASDEELAELEQALAGPALSGEDKTLAEMSDLLAALREKQFNRLAKHFTVSSVSRPDNDEKALYAKAVERLTELISSLPPHVTARLDGALDGDLLVSTKIPVADKVYRGSIPVPKSEIPPPTVQKPSSYNSSKNLYTTGAPTPGPHGASRQTPFSTGGPPPGGHPSQLYPPQQPRGQPSTPQQQQQQHGQYPPNSTPQPYPHRPPGPNPTQQQYRGPPPAPQVSHGGPTPGQQAYAAASGMPMTPRRSPYLSTGQPPLNNPYTQQQQQQQGGQLYPRTNMPPQVPGQQGQYAPSPAPGPAGAPRPGGYGGAISTASNVYKAQVAAMQTPPHPANANMSTGVAMNASTPAMSNPAGTPGLGTPGTGLGGYNGVARQFGAPAGVGSGYQAHGRPFGRQSTNPAVQSANLTAGMPMNAGQQGGGIPGGPTMSRSPGPVARSPAPMPQGQQGQPQRMGQQPIPGHLQPPQQQPPGSGASGTTQF